MSRKVQVNGAGINVSDWGAGSPILLLHGNPDSSLMWEVAQSPEAADKPRVFRGAR